MAVRIRLKRIGKNPKGKPHFRIAVFTEECARDGKCIEELGFYSPLKGDYKINIERFDYWVSKGAQPSETVASIARKHKKNQ